jgi:hypothetical protein
MATAGFLIHTKIQQEVLGETDHLLSFDTTQIA